MRRRLLDATWLVIALGPAACGRSKLSGGALDAGATDRSIPERITPDAAGEVPGPAICTDVSQITAGALHACARKINGTAWCWGVNHSGELGDGTTNDSAEPVKVADIGSGVVAIAAGGYHTCAVTTDGALWCWGDNEAGQLGNDTTTSTTKPVKVSDLGASVVEVVAGDYHTCARKIDGTVWCWGDNSSGGLGDGTKEMRPRPVRVSTLGSAAARIAASAPNDSCAVKTDGTLWCWGSVLLGDGPVDFAGPSPVEMRAVGADVVQVSLGFNDICVRKVDGTLWCWGSNDHDLKPHMISALGTATASVSLSPYAACAAKTDGTLWCWGDNQDGQLGNETTTRGDTPTQVVSPGESFVEVAVGGAWGGAGYACGRDTKNHVWCWGTNSFGQVGHATDNQTVPILVPSLATTGVDVSAGSRHTCTRDTDGEVRCWGYNYHGQLGDGTKTYRSAPTEVVGLGTVTRVVAGFDQSCAVKTDGTVWCWGYIKYISGATGMAESPTPVRIEGLPSGIADVAAGQDHACAVASNGSLWCWGAGGAVGDGTTTDRAMPIEIKSLGASVAQVVANYGITCARKTDGTVWCWGSTQLGNGETSSPWPVEVKALGSSVVQLASSSWYLVAHTCARKADGTLWCWGRNEHRQLGDGTDVGRSMPVQVTALGATVADVSTGYSRTCARRIDGTLWCWGLNDQGQVGDGTSGWQRDRMLPVQVSDLGKDVAGFSAGETHTCAFKTDGTLWCWGSNDYGELGNGAMGISTMPTPVTGCP